MMSDGALTQDEINALLSGGSLNNDSTIADAPFTSNQLNKIRSYFSALGSSGDAIFSGMAGLEAKITLSDVIVSSKEELMTKLSSDLLDVTVNFMGDVTGGHYFILNSDDAIKFGSTMVGQALSEIDGATVSAFNELFSQFSGMIATQLSAKTGKELRPVAPNGQVVAKGLSRIPASYFIAVLYRVSYEDNTFLMYEIMDELVITSLTEEVPSPAPKPSYMTTEPSVEYDRSDHQSSFYKNQIPNVQGVQLPNLTSGNTPAETRNISLLMDVMMELTVELGRTRWQIKDILGMGEGTIIELDKLAGEPVDILVNHNLIARGEVVVIDENFGVRVTEIISGMDKLAERR